MNYEQCTMKYETRLTQPTRAAQPFDEIPLYTCRDASTNHPFLCKTNPILSAVGGLQMNVSILLQMDYENKRNWTFGESKPNSNPIQTQSNPISEKPK